MQSPILVAYSTRTGSTTEVAEVIADQLRRFQLPVEIARMHDVREFSLYKAVILGAPIYLHQLPGELFHFLKRHRSHLAAMPTWFFTLGPIRGVPWEFREAAEHAATSLEKYPWFKPEEMKVFGGRFDVNKMPFPYSVLAHTPGLPLKDDPPSDVRDWSDIRMWASQIADRVSPSEEGRTGSAMYFAVGSIG